MKIEENAVCAVNDADEIKAKQKEQWRVRGGGGCVNRVRLDVKCSIPFVGKTLAVFVAADCERLIADEYEYLTGRLGWGTVYCVSGIRWMPFELSSERLVGLSLTSHPLSAIAD